MVRPIPVRFIYEIYIGIIIIFIILDFPWIIG